MSDLFSKYEDDINGLLNKIRVITSSFSTLSREKAESALSNSVGLFKEGENILSKLEIESSVHGSLSLQNKVKQYKNEFQVLQSKFQTIQDNYITKKAENAIMIGTDEDMPSDDGDNRQKNDKGLIVNEEYPNKENEDKEKQVEIAEMKVEVNHFSGSHDNQNEDDPDLNMKYEKKNKKVLIISSISIIAVLVVLIILLSIFH